nr:MAG TPA: hypothetical protein [Caudoviricetes sp.]
MACAQSPKSCACEFRCLSRLYLLPALFSQARQRLHR